MTSLALMRNDGNTYDECGNYLCKTDKSQIRPNRVCLLWTLEVELAEKNKRNPAQGCIGVIEDS